MLLFLLLSVIFPLLCGLALFVLKIQSVKAKKIICAAAVIVTSALTFLAITQGDTEKYDLLRFSEILTFSLKSDGLGHLFAGMVAFLWPFAIFYVFVYLKHDEKVIKYSAFYLMTYGVVLGVCFAANALTLYVFYELLTFITLPLITHTETKEARRAGRMYLYYSLTGSSLALAGIVILTVTAGSCSFAENGLFESLDGIGQFAYVLTFVGFGVKAAVFPMCGWLPMASAAPTPTTALLHAVAVVKSGAFAIIRFSYYFCSPAVLRGTSAQYIAAGLAALTVVYGSCMALKEQHFKRRFAYSTISNLSYILLGALILSKAGLEASLAHFLFHSVTKIGIFFCIGAIIETTGAQYVYELNGMGRKAPLVFICFTVSGLSLIGIPPFSGFVSKYYLLSSALSDGSVCSYIGAGAIIISAVLTAAYVLSVSVRAFARTPNELSQSYFDSAKEPSRGFIYITAFFSLVSLLFGLFGGTFIDIISKLTGGVA